MNEIPNDMEQNEQNVQQAQTVNPPAPPPMQTNYPFLPAPAVPKPPFEADRRECFLVILAVALGAMVRELLFLPEQPGFSVVLLIAAVYGVLVWYGKGSERFCPSAGWYYGVVEAMLLCSVVLFSNRTLYIFNLFGIYFFLALHAAAMFGHGGVGFFRDLWRSAVCAPFASADAVFRTIWTSQKIEKGTTWRKVLLGIVISVPVACVVLLLLASADGAFEDAVAEMIGSIGRTVWRMIIDLLTGAFLAIFIFSAFYTARRKKAQKMAETAAEPKLPFDSTVASTVIVVCCVIYVCFLVIQFNYLFSAVWGKLPTDTVYSEYARRGFFELTFVAGINLVLMLFAVYSKNNGGLAVRVSVTALTVLTLALIASAFSKMAMYINAYGLTPLRVYISWFMLLMAAMFLILLAGRFCKKLRVRRAVVITCAVMFLALNFAAPDVLIAKVNTERHLQNTEQRADVDLFEGLGDEAVPYLLQLAQSENGDTARDAKYLLHMRYEELSGLDWRSMNISTLRARSLLEKNKELFIEVASSAGSL